MFNSARVYLYDTSSDPKQDNIKYTGKYCNFTKIGFLYVRRQFLILYGVPEVREASRNLPGAHGFVVLQYGPMPTHGDPIQVRNYQFSATSKRPDPYIEHFFLKIDSIEI